MNLKISCYYLIFVTRMKKKIQKKSDIQETFEKYQFYFKKNINLFRCIIFLC